ncbi:MAG: hypothetical protein ACRC41_00940, partial [Sarcina sp.]
RTEKKLYNYFDRDRKIQSYTKKVDALQRYLNDLDEKIRTSNVEIEVNIPAIAFSERVQSSVDLTGEAERELMKMIAALEREKISVINQIKSLEVGIQRLQVENTLLEDNVELLRGDLKDFIYYKYRKHISQREIALKMNLSESGVTRLRRKVINIVNEFEDSVLSYRS